VTTAPKPAGPPAVTALAASRTSETTNYEVSKTVTHTIAPRGQLARLSVAVVLDDDHLSEKDANGLVKTTSKPRSAADLQRIQGLVAAAVGLDPDRGDQLTVENIAFGDPGLEDQMLPPAGWWRRIGPQSAYGLLDFARVAVVLVIGVVALLAVLRPMARRALRLPQATVLPPGAVIAGTTPRTVEDLQSDIEAEIDAGLAAKIGESRRLPALTRRIAKVADEEPEHLARLVRSMLMEEEAK
jgi:flagellar M-ring protein FliF